ncbi:bifunctional metallophosphatase/5'-nucleotidase [Leadbettera azotonutricia]|uniref:Protein UshA n=1 Tax=Leadbettera azotonutricia (strain ATCC BAA-888 / DSM 13862 / ZAS-9) TaxID=545695 RepID=F5Y6X4_LEAAZ|nr:5'-nucleotidase C-terminal domain-containing protein [Leadbettera azotonutricia]AEF82617.1 protein UshA [Leadbettera azotonutricia ZAS-9]
MKSVFKLIAIAALAALLTFPLFAEPAREAPGAAKSYELVLLHTNDHHGALLPNGGKGGLAEVAAYIKAVKATNPQVLLLDAGDINTGSALSNMFAAEPDIFGYNIMGYDAGIFGNHEFDGNQAKLVKQIGQAKFPFVSSNIKTSDGKYLGGNQYLVKKYDGFTVGIFGITTLRTKIIASPDKSLSFINEIDAAREVVNILRNREKVDIVIGVSHIGNVKEAPDHIISPELAAAIPGIDIIVDGHSHTYMEAPIKAGSTYIVSANEWGKYVGHGKLTVQNGKLANFAWKPIEIAPDAEVAKMLAPYIEQASKSLKEVVGQAADTFIFGNRLTRYQETALGNMITDANSWYFKTVYNQTVDFTFHNGGNIRAELPKGPITQELILTILPFENYLFIASLKGQEILELFNFIATIPQGAGGFPQFSKEVRFTIDKTVGDGVIKNLTIGGQPVDPNRTYRFCTNDYILGGGDGYEVMKKAVDPFNTSLLLSYVVGEYIKSEGGTISPALDGRLTVTGGVTP